MDVPPISHPAWKNIVSGKNRYQFKFLGTQFLMRYLSLRVEKDSSSDTIQSSAQELHDIFVRNADLPSVQRDLFQIFGKDTISGYMYDIIEVKSKITRGEKLLLAGDESLLIQLPAGNWIGGSIPYFMTDHGGVFTRQKIYVTELPESVSEISIKNYNLLTLKDIYSDMPPNGFSVIIMPSSSKTHLEFALHAPQFQGFGQRPLIGWISGVHLDDLGKINPKVFNGQTQDILEDGAIVMHASLPSNQLAEIDYLNIFEPGNDDTITFPKDGFLVKEAYINGVKTNFADYVNRLNLDTRLPLVADYFGALVNVSFQKVDLDNQEVKFYAPVFAGVSYKHAKPFESYISQFNAKLPEHLNKQPVFSCNCILNYVYSELEGKKTGAITGPTTFGEVVYQLLNQTMAYLTITDLSTKNLT